MRYHPLLIVLHWVMAVAFVLMLGSGLVMTKTLPWLWSLSAMDFFALYQWHKSLGVVLLALVIVRIAVRLCVPVPNLPDHVSQAAHRLARLGHRALYGFMLAVPLSGWVMVSASILGLPTIIFGWFTLPHLPGIEADAGLEKLAKSVHMVLAFGFGGMILLHLAALVLHFYRDRINLLPRMLPVIGLVSFLAGPVLAGDPAKAWQIDVPNSSIAFSGTHADTPFKGVFGQWQADINVDPAHPDQGHISVVFDTNSARTGNPLYDGTLPQVDWFNSKQYPQARFTSRTIRMTAPGQYQVTGALALRGISKDITFAARLSDPANPPVRITASIPLERLAFDIGKQSDPGAAWVSPVIMVTLDILATP